MSGATAQHPQAQHTSAAALAGRLTCTVTEAGAALGIGRNAAYAAAKHGELPTLRIGHRILVKVPELLAMVGAHEQR